MLAGVAVGSLLTLAALLSAPALLPGGGADPSETTSSAAVFPAADATTAGGATGASPSAAGAPAPGLPALSRPGSVGPVAPGAPASDALAALARAVAAAEAAVEPVVGSGTGAPSAASDEAPPAAASGPETEVVALTNARRADAGCDDLRIDPRITSAAQDHSQDMADAGYFAHDSRDGRSFADRLAAAGYPSPGAENIAQGQPDAASVVRAWMDSPGHRRNIEDCSLTTIGIGLAGGYWTQDFGR